MISLIDGYNQTWIQLWLTDDQRESFNISVTTSLLLDKICILLYLSILVTFWGWVGLWGFLWWAPSAKRKDHHGVISGWSSVWHRSNTGLSSTQYEQIPIILGVWPFWLTLLFSINNILAGLWLNCISSVEITLFLLADILLQHRALFQC